VVKAYREYLSDSQNEHTSQLVSQLTRAIEDQRSGLKSQQQEYIEFRKKAPFWWRRGPGGGDQGPGEATNVHQERVVFLDDQRRQLVVKKTSLESKLNALQDAISKNDPAEALEILIQRFSSEDGRGVSTGALTADEISALRAMEQHMLPLFQEERRLRREWGENHPQVKDIRRRIEATKSFYAGLGFPLPVDDDDVTGKATANSGESAASTRSADLVRRFVLSLKREITELGDRERRLEAQFDEELRKAKELSNLQLEDQERMAAIRNDTKLLDTLASQLSMLNIGKDNAGYALRIISNPREGIDMKKPMKFIGGATVACLGLVMATLYLRALMDTRLKTVEDVQQTLGLSIVGRVPQIDFSTAKIIPGSAIAPAVYYYHNPDTPAAESFRSIRTALFVAAHSRGMKVLQVTSSEPQDGKTSLTSSLAVAIAQTGKRVLLIDADLRCPKVQGLFGQTGKPGLIDVLTNEIDLPNAILPTEVHNLAILGAGLATASNPGELLTSPHFATLLREVRTDYDYVLVDTPPLLAVSDPCEIAPLVDGVVMVVRLHKNRTAGIKRARDLLTTNGVEPMGVVVTGVEPSASYGAYNYRIQSPLPTRTPTTTTLPTPASV